MTSRPRKRSETSPYRLAVPMSKETLGLLDDFCEEFECTRTEAARYLLFRAAELYRINDLEIGD